MKSPERDTRMVHCVLEDYSTANVPVACICAQLPYLEYLRLHKTKYGGNDDDYPEPERITDD